MSDILIRGMDMPKHCGECGIDWCYIWRRAETPTEKRPSDCPLSEVPTPHGDLIGRNPLIDIAMHLRNRAKDEYTKRVIGSVIRYIAEAPTIIQASEEVYNEEVYDKYTDKAGNLHWTGTHSGEHIIHL